MNTLLTMIKEFSSYPLTLLDFEKLRMDISLYQCWAK